ncbi:MAG: hypothetical protein ABIG44_03050 [Planctomycetota bacterium]
MVPGESIASDKVTAVRGRVVATHTPGREHVAIEVVIPDWPTTSPGQFAQLRCSGGEPGAAHTIIWPEDGFPSLSNSDTRARQAYLRRPFSIADRWDDNDGAHVLFISRTIGPGTAWLADLRRDDELDITGPLGKGFRYPDKAAPIALVGGGVGIPPLYYITRCLREMGYTDVTVVFGAAARELLPVVPHNEPSVEGVPMSCVQLPGGADYPAIVTTDDGSAGLRGRVTDGLELWYQHYVDSQARGEVLACGPEPMLQAVAALTRRMGSGCQLCIERNMGCGLGTCQSCVVRVREAGAPGWRWGLTCLEGPVFERNELPDYDTPAG